MSESDQKFAMMRIEALGTTAVINSNNHGGDNATAAADLMCAFVLMVRRNRIDPDLALASMWEHAKATCDYWFDDGQRPVQ